MRKMIYFIQKSPALTQPWPFRWRKHAAFAMTRPFWGGCRKYAHCDPIQGWIGTANALHSFDGLGVNWHNKVGPAWMGDDEGVRLMREDETRIFASYVTDSALLMDESVLREGAAPFKVFSLSRRVQGLPEQDFLSIWSTYGADVMRFSASASVRRLSFSTVVAHEYTKFTRMVADGIGEFSFDSLEDARDFFTSPEIEGIRTRNATALKLDQLLIGARENVFYDQDKGIDQRAQMIATYLLPG